MLEQQPLPQQLLSSILIFTTLILMKGLGGKELEFGVGGKQT